MENPCTGGLLIDKMISFFKKDFFITLKNLLKNFGNSLFFCFVYVFYD